jgi:hypothetical protein
MNRSDQHLNELKLLAKGAVKLIKLRQEFLDEILVCIEDRLSNEEFIEFYANIYKQEIVMAWGKSEANDSNNTVEQAQKDYQSGAYHREVTSNRDQGAAPVKDEKK